MSLTPLSRKKDYQFPSGTFDVRGWPVRTQADDARVGRVEDIIIDNVGQPRYLDVKLGVADRHILVPLYRAHPHVDDEVVWMDGMTKDRILDVPGFAHEADALTPAYEGRLAEAWEAVAAGRTPARQFDGPVPAGDFARLGSMDDFRVASADTDPRGWKVIAGDGRKIGEVKELIVDRETLSARYLDCDVDESELDLEPIDRHVLIPVDRVRLNADDHRVVVDGILAPDIASYPVYAGLPITSDAKQRLDALYGERRSAVSGTGPSDRAPHDVLVEREDREVLIRVTGDDVIVEKRPRA